MKSKLALADRLYDQLQHWLFPNKFQMVWLVLHLSAVDKASYYFWSILPNPDDDYLHDCATTYFSNIGSLENFLKRGKINSNIPGVKISDRQSRAAPWFFQCFLILVRTDIFFSGVTRINFDILNQLFKNIASENMADVTVGITEIP